MLFWNRYRRNPCRDRPCLLSAIGLVLNAVILAYGIWMIRWDHMTIENLSSIQNLNPANEKDIIEWLQQFIKVDISGMVN